MKLLCDVIDVRAGNRRPTLLAVSIHHGVIPREYLTDDDPRADSFESYKLCEPGDLVLNRMRAFQGAIGVADRSGIVSPDYLVLRPRRGIEARFLHYLFRSSWFVGEMVARLRGIGSVDTGSVRTPRINADDLFDIRVHVPPRMEQQAIADYLDRETARIDALTAAKQRMIVLIQQQAEAHRAVWYEQLARRSGVVPLRRLIRLLEQGWSPQCDNVPSAGDEWGVLKTSSVSSGAFRADENKRLPEYVRPERRWVVRDGDLLVVRGSGSAGAVGQAAVAHPRSERLLLSDLLYRVHLVDAVPEFVAGALRASQVRSQLEGAIRTDAGQTLKVRGDDLRALLIPALPATDQQRAVEALASVLHPLAKISDRLTGSIDLLRERREALIAAAVTGSLSTAVAA